MRLPGIGTLVSPARLLWTVLRSPVEPLTLDQVRSDLSHETAAKIARLSGLIHEWREARFRPEDADSADAILQDLERIYLRHARLAGARFGTFDRLARLLAAVQSARRTLPSLRAQPVLQSETIAWFSRFVATLAANSRDFVEAITGRHAARFADLVATVVEEVRRELQLVRARQVSVVLEGAGCGAGAWVPFKEARLWSDALRNLVRNAVQATEDKREDLRGPQSTLPLGESRSNPAEDGAALLKTPFAGSAPENSHLPGTVTVRVQPTPGRAGTIVEVLDEGVGMTSMEIEAMWRSGNSTHGIHRGHGLTESKRTWLEQRASVEVRSARWIGTCVRIDVPHRDVPVRPPRLWTLRPVILPAAILLAMLILGWKFFAGSSAGQPPAAPAEIATVDLEGGQVVRAYDARGLRLWRRDMGEEVLPNCLGNPYYRLRRVQEPMQQLILNGQIPGGPGVVLATRPRQGAGKVYYLDVYGRTRWVRTLSWRPPADAYTGNLLSFFETPTPWNRDGKTAIALNVRDCNHSATAIEFISLDGATLGTYYHPGHLEYLASKDVDGDGRSELLLIGCNNDADQVRAFLPRNLPRGHYVACLVMLEPPAVDGQAFPYTGWMDVPRAQEEAYLLVPPLRDGMKVEAVNVDLGTPTTPGAARIEFVILDGRVYRLDGNLRPQACRAGDNTPASSLAPTKALGPLVYISRGRVEYIDLPVQ